MMRRVLLLVTLLLVFLAGAAATYHLHNSRTFQLAGDLVPRVATTERVVALTFDDGPLPERVDWAIDTLATAGVRATFFVVGASMAEAPEAAERLVAAGHELGNHSYSHERLVLRPPDEIRREIEATDGMIRAAGQAGPITVRPPYGKKLLLLPLYLAQTGRVTVTWDVEPDSYPEVAADPQRIVAHVVERVRPGSIVLLHIWPEVRATSRAAVPSLVSALKGQGYTFITVSRLLALRR